MVNLTNFGKTYTNNVRIHGVNYTVSEIRGPLSDRAGVRAKVVRISAQAAVSKIPYSGTRRRFTGKSCAARFARRREQPVERFCVHTWDARQKFGSFVSFF
jgi:hypothetical protein